MVSEQNIDRDQRSFNSTLHPSKSAALNTDSDNIPLNPQVRSQAAKQRNHRPPLAAHPCYQDTPTTSRSGRLRYSPHTVRKPPSPTALTNKPRNLAYQLANRQRHPSAASSSTFLAHMTTPGRRPLAKPTCRDGLGRMRMLLSEECERGGGRSSRWVRYFSHLGNSSSEHHLSSGRDSCAS